MEAKIIFIEAQRILPHKHRNYGPVFFPIFFIIKLKAIHIWKERIFLYLIIFFWIFFEILKIELSRVKVYNHVPLGFFFSKVFHHIPLKLYIFRISSLSSTKWYQVWLTSYLKKKFDFAHPFPCIFYGLLEWCWLINLNFFIWN